MTLGQLIVKKENREKRLKDQRLILQSFSTNTDVSGEYLLSVVIVIIKLERDLDFINNAIRETRGGMNNDTSQDS